MKFLYLFVLLLHIFALASTFGGDGDLGLSVGSSAASKLVQNAVENQLRQPRLMQVDVNSANEPWFKEVARLDSRNRIAIESLEVNFRDRQQIEVQGNNMHLNSTTFINNAALPLWFLDQKSVLLHVEIKRAYLRLNVDKPATLRIEECEIEQGNVELALERSYFVNLLLKALRGTMTDQIIKERVCGMLLDTAIDLREKYSLELPLKSVVPEKFTRYLIKENVDLRSHIQSINAAADQITIAAVMEWATNNLPSTEGTHSMANSVRITDLFSVEDSNNPTIPNDSKDEQTTKPSIRSPSFVHSSSDHSTPITERLLLWAEIKLFNDIFNQFRWDFQWVNESIQFGSPKLPKETRDFFEVICPQCYFLFNVSADGVPDIQIREKSIIIRNRNRIAAAVLNPTIGQFGQKRTAIDLSMELQFKFVPEIHDGIFRTYLELLDHKVEVKNGSAFPPNMYKLVEQLIQDLIAEDIWPVLQRELKPLIYESGIQLPNSCGLDPKSAQLHFEQGRFGVSAHLFLENWSNTTNCVQQLKSGLPDPSKLFVNLPKEHKKKKRG